MFCLLASSYAALACGKVEHAADTMTAMPGSGGVAGGHASAGASNNPGRAGAPTRDADVVDASVDDASNMHTGEPGDAALADAGTPLPDAGTPLLDAGTPLDDAAGGASGDATDGRPAPHASCEGLPAICGPTHTDDCCAASVVAGGTFSRDNDPRYPATVSTFGLDKYEVTVGRFRKFYAALELGWKPARGSGKNPNAPADLGWQAAATRLTTLRLHQGPFCEAGSTWTTSPIDVVSESLPVNCINWEAAFAFCIWDDGRLPTEAEWNYAAAGGGDQSGQREYPWSRPPSSRLIDHTLANYGGETCGSCLVPVGSHPQGEGRFGQLDLAGNVAEFVLDPGGQYVTPCTDCVALFSDPTAGHAIRGGSAVHMEAQVLTSARYVPKGNAAQTAHYFVGMRCARDPASVFR